MWPLSIALARPSSLSGSSPRCFVLPSALAADPRNGVLGQDARRSTAVTCTGVQTENSYSLIAQLREVGIPVIMLSGSIEFAMPISLKGVVMLEKPVKEEQLLEHLRPIATRQQE